jgi:DNA-binding XRE family transcriptional regulator
LSTFASLIRSEVLRLARKETRAAVSPLRKQVTSLRRKVAQQRRQIAELTRAARQVTRAPAAPGAAVASDGAPGPKVRFSPRWMRRHRAKLGMSREAYAKLLGASAQSVLGWESGRTRPRQAAIVLWARLRQMRVRDIKSGMARSGAKAAMEEAKPRRRRRSRVRPRRVRRTKRAPRKRVRAARRRAPSKKTGTRRRR